MGLRVKRGYAKLRLYCEFSNRSLTAENEKLKLQTFEKIFRNSESEIKSL